MTRGSGRRRPPEACPSLVERLAGRAGRLLRRSRGAGHALRRREAPSIGRHAERLVARELARRRMHVLEVNFATRYGEIDLVARKGSTIVFVEVKARTSVDAVSPGEAVTPRKQKRIARAAKAYLAHHEMHEADIRFDVAEVIFGDSGASHEIRIIEDAFIPPR